MRTIVAIACLLALPSAGSATDLSVAGLRLGAPIVTTPCAGSAAIVELMNKNTCITDVVQLGPDLWTGWIILPYGDKPAIMASGRLKAYSKGGLLVGVSFSTRGLISQEGDLDDLAKKYGTPTNRYSVPMQNRLGGKFDAILATWALDGLSVSFLASMARYDQGEVSVYTSAGKEVMDADRDAREKALNPRKL